jgi:hypothetical protein
MPRRQLPARSSRWTGSRGQSLVEFAILLPLLLAFVGVSLDFARVYQAWITLESATRDAAEYAATVAVSESVAETEARRLVCLQTQGLPGFEPGPGPASLGVAACRAPSIALVAFDLSTTAAGASSRNPVGSATVRASLPFRPLFSYPFLTTDGVWLVGSTSTFSVIQGR